MDALLSADERRRSAVSRADSLRGEQKVLGKQVGRAQGDERAALLAKGKELAAEVKAAEAEQSEADTALVDAQKRIQNIVEPGVPEGGEDDFVVLKHVGERPEFDFAPRDHVQLGEGIGAIDLARGAKVSGARFYFLTGVGAQLQLGLLTSLIFGLVGIIAQVVVMRVFEFAMRLDIGAMLAAEKFTPTSIVVAAANVALGLVVAVAIS